MLRQQRLLLFLLPFLLDLGVARCDVAKAQTRTHTRAWGPV
jgi:hypothetical protein